MDKNVLIDFSKNKRINRVINLLSVVTIVVCLLLVSVGKSVVYAGSISSEGIVSMVNMERSSRGLKNLQVDQNLTVAAYMKAFDMLSKQYWSHYGPNGESPWKFILSAGYDYKLAGENLAYGFDDSFDVYNAWMNSDQHKENIIKGSFEDIGVAIVRGNLNGKDTVLVVQLFGTKTSSVTNQSVDGDSKLSQDIEGLKILYPEDGGITSGSLFGVLGIHEDIPRSQINIYIDGNQEGPAIISGSTFSMRLDLSEEGLHDIEAKLVQDGVEIDKETVRTEITQVSVSSIVSSFDVESGVVHATIIDSSVASALFQSNNDVKECEVSSSLVTCSELGNINSGKLILINQDGDVIFSKDIDLSSQAVSANSSEVPSNSYFTNKNLILSASVILLSLELVRTFYGGKYGYKIGLLFVSIALQFAGTSGYVI